CAGGAPRAPRLPSRGQPQRGGQTKSGSATKAATRRMRPGRRGPITLSRIQPTSLESEPGPRLPKPQPGTPAGKPVLRYRKSTVATVWHGSLVCEDTVVTQK